MSLQAVVTYTGTTIPDVEGSCGGGCCTCFSIMNLKISSTVVVCWEACETSGQCSVNNVCGCDTSLVAKGGAGPADKVPFR